MDRQAILDVDIGPVRNPGRRRVADGVYRDRAARGEVLRPLASRRHSGNLIPV